MEECKSLGIDEVHFIDDVFNADMERVINICNEIKRRALKISWSFRGRIDKITKYLLIRVKETGCYRIHLGVETSTDEGLKRLKKGITVEQIRQVFKWTREIGINTVAYFLIGCPYEKTKEDVLGTINFSKDIDPDFALFNILTPYPSTELYEESLRKGKFKTDYWKEFALNPREDFEPLMWKEWLSREELIFLLNFAYRSFYLRPRFLYKALITSHGLTSLPKRLKIGLDIFSSSLKGIY
jgi:radical SAM superfamily enzyme YgiQ (UPF0313 family)